MLRQNGKNVVHPAFAPHINMAMAVNNLEQGNREYCPLKCRFPFHNAQTQIEWKIDYPARTLISLAIWLLLAIWGPFEQTLKKLRVIFKGQTLKPVFLYSS